MSTRRRPVPSDQRPAPCAVCARRGCTLEHPEQAGRREQHWTPWLTLVAANA